ncbi:hypothetical protein MPTK1_6g17170 [Marchantia polymorpha subsp. ruderalis]|uniref:Uncharacterized protein n=1 Tax=Marchantia polymorpha subsp. ruderalis TaxID=1480154 RepID=A0AAF6BSY1_MARPO|nr:hypothetical protein Mp_6g17170 [Marchantia polymorpha subsp. ruderalis]
MLSRSFLPMTTPTSSTFSSAASLISTSEYGQMGSRQGQSTDVVQLIHVERRFPSENRGRG